MNGPIATGTRRTTKTLSRLFSSAGGGNRTHTPLAGPRILSPVRLPVPPPRLGGFDRSYPVVLPIFPFIAWLAPLTSAGLLIGLWFVGDLRPRILAVAVGWFLIAGYCQF